MPTSTVADDRQRSWLHEPLVHFLALGALLFAANALLSGPSSPDSDKTIIVTEGDIRRLVGAWEMQWRRPPSREELTNLVRDHVREEVLYREALALGLDQDDSIVRRRMAQKMQFLSEDTAAEEEPSESELREYYEENSSKFETPGQVTFTHAYFSPDKRGERARADAAEALESGNDPPQGDRFMLQSHYAQRTRDQLAGLFGGDFADAVLALEPGPWSGPVESGYGFHLVRLESKVDAVLPSFNEVRGQVRDAWVDRNRRQANDRLYERLREDYEVEIAAGIDGLEGLE